MFPRRSGPSTQEAHVKSFWPPLLAGSEYLLPVLNPHTVSHPSHIRAMDHRSVT